MTCAPIHPNLLLDRPLTRDEMLEALRYEGMFGLGDPADVVTALELEHEGLAFCELWPGGRGWVVCITEKGRKA